MTKDKAKTAKAGFYALSKVQRAQLVVIIANELLKSIADGKPDVLLHYYSDSDTYIRKISYEAVGRVFVQQEHLRGNVLSLLDSCLTMENEKIRQTAVNTTGEIGKMDFSSIEHILEKSLADPHHSVRNAVIGALKQITAKNASAALDFSRRYLHHTDKEIRREICHGLELRGRTHPQDILPLLRELQYEQTPRVRNMLIHVLGQISYKKGCLEIVLADLKTWNNSELVFCVLEEILAVHESYKNFAALTREEARKHIESRFPE